MSDLVAFLRARLDEDEQAARATTGPWKYHHDTGGVVLPTARHVPELTEIISTPREPSDARHMVRWDSARVLREVEAKRQVVDAYAEALRIQDGFHETTGETMQREALEMACRAYAAAYADHPDYVEAVSAPGEAE